MRPHNNDEILINSNAEGSEESCKGIGMGLCFGAGIGIVAGAIINNVPLGLTLGAALGVAAGSIYDFTKNKKKKIKS